MYFSSHLVAASREALDYIKRHIISDDCRSDAEARIKRYQDKQVSFNYFEKKAFRGKLLYNFLGLFAQ